MTRPSGPLTSRLWRSPQKWKVMIFRDKQTLHHNIYIDTVIITFLLLYIYKNFNLLPDDAVVGRQPLCSRITFVESSLKQDILGIVEDHYNHFNYNHKWWWWFCLIISALWWPWPCDSPMDQRVRYDFLVGHRQRQKLYTNSFSNSKITAEDKHIFFW